MTLTVRQPWASFLVPTDEVIRMVLTGRMGEWASKLPKRVENRTWGTTWSDQGGQVCRTIVIGAGLQIDQPAMDRFGLDLDRFVTGAVVGTVILRDIVFDSESVWAERHPDPSRRMRHWLVDHPVAFAEPVKCAGVRGLRPVPETVLELVRRQLIGK